MRLLFFSSLRFALFFLVEKVNDCGCLSPPDAECTVSNALCAASGNKIYRSLYMFAPLVVYLLVSLVLSTHLLALLCSRALVLLLLL
jgi:hypothetical protein